MLGTSRSPLCLISILTCTRPVLNSLRHISQGQLWILINTETEEHIKSCVLNRDFINKVSVWNVMIKRDMPGLWMSPESLKESRLTLEANGSPLQKWPGSLFGHVVHDSLSRVYAYDMFYLVAC